jgi:hypothetical protein
LSRIELVIPPPGSDFKGGPPVTRVGALCRGQQLPQGGGIDGLDQVADQVASPRAMTPSSMGAMTEEIRRRQEEEERGSELSRRLTSFLGRRQLGGLGA